MTIRHLYIFKIVCEEGSFTKAARRLYMTQPAISHAISELEEEIGLPLFDRLSKRIYLNESGQRLLPKALRLLELYEELKASALSPDQQLPLRIGSTITIGNYWLPSIMRRFCSTHRQIQDQVIIEQAGAVTTKLLSNELDIALIEGPLPYPQLVSHPFSSYRLLFLCSPLHPCAQNQLLTLKELNRQRLLVREKGSAIRDTLESAFTLSGLSLSPSWTSVNSQALIQAAKAGLGITVLPDIMVKEDIKKGELISLKVNKLSLKNVNHLVYHKDKYISDALRGFINAVLSEPQPPSQIP